MFTLFKNKLQDQDKFHHVTAHHVRLNKKLQHKTLLGGINSTLLWLFVLWLWYTNLYIMFKYKGNVVNIFETATKFDEIGVQRVDEMGTLPFFAVYY